MMQWVSTVTNGVSRCFNGGLDALKARERPATMSPGSADPV
jgi:hypothetical protein